MSVIFILNVYEYIFGFGILIILFYGFLDRHLIVVNHYPGWHHTTSITIIFQCIEWWDLCHFPSYFIIVKQLCILYIQIYRLLRKNKVYIFCCNGKSECQRILLTSGKLSTFFLSIFLVLVWIKILSQRENFQQALVFD